MKKLTSNTVMLAVSFILIASFLTYKYFICDGELIPRKILFGNPDKAQVSISPDGKKIAYLSSKDGVLNVYVADRQTPTKAKPITNDKKRGISGYLWAYDGEHILYFQDEDGDENWRIYTVNINNLKVKNLTPFKKTLSWIAKSSEHIPDKIIIAMNKRDPRYFDLYEADIISGKLKLFYKNNNKTTNPVISDDEGKYKLQFVTKNNDDGSKAIYKVQDNFKLKLFLNIPEEDAWGSTRIIGLGKTSDIVYILNSIGRNTNALTQYNQKSGITKVIYHDPKTDITGVSLKPRERNIQIVYNTFLKRTERILDAEIAEDISYLNNFNKEYELSIASRDLEDKYWIIGYMADDKPFNYYLYDRRNKKLKFLFSNRKKLEKYELAPMHPLVIKSRDGLDLVSYLTIPINVSDSKKRNFIPTKPVPLILNVHGGPKGPRDNWGLNNLHQWLANRGYAVLSVNYRASGGFGKEFLNAGDGEWGKKMHDDLLDAVNWAIDNKITTKDKICIFGGSYGGYAALVGVTFTPDVFACAVDIVGPSNLNTLIKSIPKYWFSYTKQYWKMLGGNPNTKEGREFLKSRSPLTYVKNIKKPLLIAQGANDPRVKQAESDQIVEAMKKNNIPVTYLLYPDEGHGFARPENRLSFFAVTEKFLAKNLGGAFEPIGDSFKDSSVKLLEKGECCKDLKNK